MWGAGGEGEPAADRRELNRTRTAVQPPAAQHASRSSRSSRVAHPRTLLQLLLDQLAGQVHQALADDVGRGLVVQQHHLVARLLQVLGVGLCVV